MLYDDLARDYLGPTVPSRADLLAKEDLGDALWRGRRMPLTVYAWDILRGRPLHPGRPVKGYGMYSLYTDIEMPLIYSLFHMEQEGVKVERAELKEYGDRLKVGIAKLEQEIYQETGHEFNINSPSSWERFSLNRWSFREAKRQRPVIPRQRMCWKNWRLIIRWSRKSWTTAS